MINNHIAIVANDIIIKGKHQAINPITRQIAGIDNDSKNGYL